MFAMFHDLPSIGALRRQLLDSTVATDLQSFIHGNSNAENVLNNFVRAEIAGKDTSSEDKQLAAILDFALTYTQVKIQQVWTGIIFSSNCSERSATAIGQDLFSTKWASRPIKLEDTVPSI